MSASSKRSRTARRKQNRERARRDARRLRFESLEDRRLLAFNIIDDDLIIEGTEGDDRYELRYNSTSALLEIEENGKVYGFKPTSFDTITFDTRAGDDTIEVELTLELVSGAYEVEIDGGAGTNSLNLVGEDFYDTTVKFSDLGVDVCVEDGLISEYMVQFDMKNVGGFDDATKGSMEVSSLVADSSFSYHGTGMLQVDKSPSISLDKKSSLRVSSLGGANRFHAWTRNFAQEVTFVGDGDDVAILDHSGDVALQAEANYATATNAGSKEVRFFGMAELQVRGIGQGDAIRVSGRSPSLVPRDDRIQVKPLGGSESNFYVNGSRLINIKDFDSTTIDTGGANDTVEVIGSHLRDVVEVRSGEIIVNQQRIGLVNHEKLFVDLDDGDDQISVVGDAKVAMELHGGGAANGDRLFYAAKSDSNLKLASPLESADQLVEPNLKPVAFSGFEDVNIDAKNKDFKVSGTGLNDLLDVFKHPASNAASAGGQSASPSTSEIRRDGFDTRFMVENAGKQSFDLAAGEDHLRIHSGDGDNKIDASFSVDSTIIVDQQLKLGASGVESISLLTGDGEDETTVRSDGKQELTLNVDGAASHGETTTDQNTLRLKTQIQTSINVGLENGHASAVVDRLNVFYKNFDIVVVDRAQEWNGLQKPIISIGATNGDNSIYVGGYYESRVSHPGSPRIAVDDHTPIWVIDVVDFDSVDVYALGGNDRIHTDAYVGNFKIYAGKMDDSDTIIIPVYGEVELQQRNFGSKVTNANNHQAMLFDVEFIELVGDGQEELTYTTAIGDDDIRFQANVAPGVHRLQTGALAPVSLVNFSEDAKLEFENEGDDPRQDRLRLSLPDDENVATISGDKVVVVSEHLPPTPKIATPGVSELMVHGGLSTDRFVLADGKAWDRVELQGGDARVSGSNGGDSVRWKGTGQLAAQYQTDSLQLVDTATSYALKSIDQVEVIAPEALKVSVSSAPTDVGYESPALGRGRVTLPGRATIYHESTQSVNVVATGGPHTLSVAGQPSGERISANEGSIIIGPSTLSYAGSFQAINIDAREGLDTIEVTPGTRPVFVDGGGPIGFGDKLVVNAPAKFYPGPENDEGGFDTPGKAPVSYDHIESAVAQKEEEDEFDWGDLVAYDTTAAQNGPRHKIVEGFHLGESVDAEADAKATQAGDGASGDDSDQSDDEDGVKFGFLSIQQPGQADVTASKAGLLDAWIDFDQDGKFDLNEHLNNGTSYALAAGANTISFHVAATSPGFYAARFRFHDSNAGPLGPTDLPNGTVPNGEVEDYALVIATLDYGDAPDSYQTLQASGGPRHSPVSVQLGPTIDHSADGIPSVDADGDDKDNIDDEDGVTIPMDLVIGHQNTISIDVQGGDGSVRGWMDFNRNGQFEATELIVDQRFNGKRQFSVAVPGDIEPGPSFARFRVTTETEKLGPAGVLSHGATPNGEVEDYRIHLVDGECPPDDENCTGPFGAAPATDQAPKDVADTPETGRVSPTGNISQGDRGPIHSGPANGAANPFDVDGDNQVTLVDAYIVIDQLNHYLNALLAAIDGDAPSFASDYDVNGDAAFSEADVHQTIDALRERLGKRASRRALDVAAEGESRHGAAAQFVTSEWAAAAPARKATTQAKPTAADEFRHVPTGLPATNHEVYFAQLAEPQQASNDLLDSPLDFADEVFDALNTETDLIARPLNL